MLFLARAPPSPGGRAIRLSRRTDGDMSTTYPPKTFCWNHLAAPDMLRAAAFYEQVLGWTAVHRPDGYTIFKLEGKDAAGGRENPKQGQWLCSVSVEDVEVATLEAERLGARILSRPASLEGAAQTALLEDPLGAIFGLWQSEVYPGAEPGICLWNELLSPDIDVSVAFYEALFGWKMQKAPNEYTMFLLGDRPVAGIIPSTHRAWMPFFRAADCDASARAAGDNGGEVQKPATDAPGVGRYAIIRDVGGAYFGVLQPPS